MDESIDSSGVGGWITTSVVRVYGSLWGRGDISIMSMVGAGEDDGKGGVVMTSSVNSFSMQSLSNDPTVISYHVVHPLRTSSKKTKTDEGSPVEDCAAGQHCSIMSPVHLRTNL
jgi:hypothetical protein